MANQTRVIRIDNLDSAVDELKKLGVAEEGVKIMAPKAIFRAIKIYDVDVRAANILKQEMLARGGEAAVSWQVYKLEPGQADVIILGTLKQLREVVSKLEKQPFGLPQIASQIKAVLEAETKPWPLLKAGNYKLNLAKRSYIMGVLNVTPDSFSDGGLYLDRDKAIEHGLKIAEEGADIIDIGGESTRPGSEPVSEEEELRRVIPVISGLAKQVKIPISIDTYKYKVAYEALEAGAVIINDITGLADPKMVDLAVQRQCPVIIMHMKGTPKNMQENPVYKDLIGEITDFFLQRTEAVIKAGLSRDKILIDPGIGFGKTVQHNLEILLRLSEFKSLGFPLVLGTSRKSFIGKVLGLPVEQRLEGTAATVAYGIAQGAAIVRVHDVYQMVRVARMTDAILRGWNNSTV
jgi:dihydropteroate synthase